MSGKLKRYQIEAVIDHLASNYVLGTLTELVRKRVDGLRADYNHQLLNDRIQYWEQKMSPLNDMVPPIEPKKETWQQIQSRISPVAEPEKRSWFSSLGLGFYQWATGFSVVLALTLGLLLSVDQTGELNQTGNLSYVAVLADDDQKPQVVAATYGESKLLMLDILDLPKVSEDETLELWVTSKTDFQARSLGEIPTDVASFQRQLTTAEWRLIKDSDSLLITVEEAGGSPIGEPLGEVISQGLCIRLSGWEEQV